MWAPNSALIILALLATLFTSCAAALARGRPFQLRATASPVPGLPIVNGGRRPNVAVHLEADDSATTTAPFQTTTATTAVPTSSKSKVCFPASKCVDYLVCGVRFGSCYQNHCDGVVPTFSTPVCASSTMMRVTWVSTTTTLVATWPTESTSTDSPVLSLADTSEPKSSAYQVSAQTDSPAATPTELEVPAATDVPVV